MLKPLLGLAALGVGGYLAYRVIWAVLLPLVALLAGFVIWALKLVLVIVLVWVGYLIFRRLGAPDGARAR